MSTNKTNRDPVIALARVTGMIFIVLCHIIKYYSFLPGHTVLGQFFNCGVYLFIYISGYLYGNKSVDDFRQWYIRRILKIAVPAVILSSITILCLLAKGIAIPGISIIVYCLDFEGIQFLCGNLTKHLFSEIPELGSLWFTTIIMLCYLLIPVLQKLRQLLPERMNCKDLIFAFIFGSLISILLSEIINLLYFMVFIIGYFSGTSHLLERANISFFIVYTVLFIAALAGRLILHKYIDGSGIYLQYANISQCIVGTWFLFLYSAINRRYPYFTEKIADSYFWRSLDSYSYYVYLTHYVLCVGVFNLFNRFSLLTATICFFLGVTVMSFLLKLVCKQFY